MKLLGIIFGVIAWEIGWMLFFHERGYKRGMEAGKQKFFEDGYLRGRKDADNWWIGVEQGYAEGREQVKKGEWP